jgi:hypothetical protein
VLLWGAAKISLARALKKACLAATPEKLVNYGAMIAQQQYESVVERAAQMLQRAGIVLTAEERARFEAADSCPRLLY